MLNLEELKQVLKEETDNEQDLKAEGVALRNEIAKLKIEEHQLKNAKLKRLEELEEKNQKEQKEQGGKTNAIYYVSIFSMLATIFVYLIFIFTL